MPASRAAYFDLHFAECVWEDWREGQSKADICRQLWSSWCGGVGDVLPARQRTGGFLKKRIIVILRGGHLHDMAWI